MALATSPEMQAYLAQAIRDYMREQEQTIRYLLGQWVSGLEPVIIYDWDTGIARIRGIGIEDDPTGMVVIPNPKWRPRLSILRRFATAHGPSTHPSETTKS